MAITGSTTAESAVAAAFLRNYKEEHPVSVCEATHYNVILTVDYNNWKHMVCAGDLKTRLAVTSYKFRTKLLCVRSNICICEQGSKIWLPNVRSILKPYCKPCKSYAFDGLFQIKNHISTNMDPRGEWACD